MLENKYDVDKYIQFNTVVTQAEWYEDNVLRDSEKNKATKQKFTEIMTDRLGPRTDLVEAIFPDFPSNCRIL